MFNDTNYKHHKNNTYDLVPRIRHLEDDKKCISNIANVIFSNNIRLRNNSEIMVQYCNCIYDCFYDKSTNIEHLPREMELLIEFTSDMLNKNNLKVTKKNFMIKIHSYNLFGEKIKYCYDWHNNNHESMGCKVHTLLVCIRKDKTIKGGNLLYISKYNTYDTNKIKKLVTLYTNNDTNSIDEQALCIEGIFSESFNKNEIILLNGNTTYNIEDMRGCGCFDFIEIQLKQNSKYKKKYNKKY